MKNELLLSLLLASSSAIAGVQIDLSQPTPDTSEIEGNTLPILAANSSRKNQKQADKICARLTGVYLHASDYSVANATVGEIVASFPNAKSGSIMGGVPVFLTHRFESVWPVGVNTIVSDTVTERPYRAHQRVHYFTSVTCE